MMRDKGFVKGQRVRVSKPETRHAHTKGWEGTLGDPIKKGFRGFSGYWTVHFLGGSSTYKQDELETA